MPRFFTNARETAHGTGGRSDFETAADLAMRKEAIPAAGRSSTSTAGPGRGSRRAWDEAARAKGVRFIAVDRPGMGLSDYRPRRTLVDWPDDVIQVAAALRLDRFAVLGISCGGPYAAACAWKISERLTRAES